MRLQGTHCRADICSVHRSVWLAGTLCKSVLLAFEVALVMLTLDVHLGCMLAGLSSSFGMYLLLLAQWKHCAPPMPVASAPHSMVQLPAPDNFPKCHAACHSVMITPEPLTECSYQRAGNRHYKLTQSERSSTAPACTTCRCDLAHCDLLCKFILRQESTKLALSMHACLCSCLGSACLLHQSGSVMIATKTIGSCHICSARSNLQAVGGADHAAHKMPGKVCRASGCDATSRQLPLQPGPETEASSALPTFIESRRYALDTLPSASRSESRCSRSRGATHACHVAAAPLSAVSAVSALHFIYKSLRAWLNTALHLPSSANCYRAPSLVMACENCGLPQLATCWLCRWCGC